MNEETLAIRLYLCLCGGLGAYSLQFFLYQEEFQQSSCFILRTDVTLVCSLNDNIISLGVKSREVFCNSRSTKCCVLLLSNIKGWSICSFPRHDLPRRLHNTRTRNVFRSLLHVNAVLTSKKVTSI